jgi:serine/threonine protein kinase
VNPKTNEEVAIKIIKKKPQSVAAVRKEVAIHMQAGVHHNVIRLLATDEDENNMFLVMEMAAAGELFDRIGK